MDNLEFNFVQLLVLFGSLQGFIFGSIIFLNKKHRNSSTLYIGLTIFVLSFSNLNHVLFDLESEVYFILLLSKMYIPWHWLVAPFLYCYVNSYYGNIRLSKKQFLLLFAPFFIVTLIHLGYFFDNTHIIKAYYQQGLFFYTNLVSFIHTPAIILCVYKMVIKNETQSKSQLHKIKNQTKWFKNIIFTGLAICTLGVLLIVTILIFSPNSPFIGYPFFLSLSLWIYWIGYLSLNKSIPLISNKHKSISKKEDNGILHKTGSATFNKINLRIKGEKLYLDHNLNLNTISEKFEISSGYLSQLINQHAEKSFNDYINELRIETAKNMLTNSEYNNYTIDAIALECGFKSKSNFYTIFKKSTSKTPNQYKKH